MADNLPPALKPIQPFLVISKQFTKRDPIVSYYASMYSVQEGIRLAKSDPSAKAYLITLMDNIEKMKSVLKDEEALSSDVVGQAHIETVALQLFAFADKADRNAEFSKNMIKAFFTASHIFTILKQFGELSDEIEEKMKYAKWKAVEIDRCLKNGITPTPGPPGEQQFEDEATPTPPVGFNIQPPAPGPSDQSGPPPSISDWQQPAPQSTMEVKPTPKPRHSAPPPQATPSYDQYGGGGWETQPPPATTGVQLGPHEISKAQKLCKFASSALEYEDVQGAMEYLGKAMKLLQTGKEEG